MLEAPPFQMSVQDEQNFRAALKARNAGLLRPGMPRWVFLEWLAREGSLLHGAARGHLTVFEPRSPHDLGPDEFSKRTGVYAASDGMYALRDRLRVERMLNMALRMREPDGGWSATRYFLSLAPRDPAVQDGRALLAPSFVYVLPTDGFEQMPPYEHQGLGWVLEPHWVNPQAVLLCVPVSPADFPLPVRVHDAARVDALCGADPWGFPWLDGKAERE